MAPSAPSSKKGPPSKAKKSARSSPWAPPAPASNAADPVIAPATPAFGTLPSMRPPQPPSYTHRAPTYSPQVYGSRVYAPTSHPPGYDYVRNLAAFWPTSTEDTSPVNPYASTRPPKQTSYTSRPPTYFLQSPVYDYSPGYVPTSHSPGYFRNPPASTGYNLPANPYASSRPPKQPYYSLSGPTYAPQSSLYEYSPAYVPTSHSPGYVRTLPASGPALTGYNFPANPYAFTSPTNPRTSTSPAYSRHPSPVPGTYYPTSLPPAIRIGTTPTHTATPRFGPGPRAHASRPHTSGYISQLPPRRPAPPTPTAKLSEHDQSPEDTPFRVKKPTQLFDLPQELVDAIFEFAYPEEDLSKFVEKSIWDEREMEFKRMNFEYERRPLPSQKVSEFLVSKKFFECATAAWVGNQEFITPDCRPRGSRRSIFDYLGTGYGTLTIVERLCKRLTTGLTEHSFFRMPQWNRLPSLNRLTLLIGARVFEVLEQDGQRFAWEFALTDGELRKVVASCPNFDELSGLVEFVLVPSDIKYARSKRQKGLWQDNVKALETILRHIVLSPLALHKLFPETAKTQNVAVGNAIEGVTKIYPTRGRSNRAVVDDSKTLKPLTPKVPAAGPRTKPALPKFPAAARSKKQNAKAKTVDFTGLVANGKVYDFTRNSTRGATHSSSTKSPSLESKPELTTAQPSDDKHGDGTAELSSDLEARFKQAMALALASNESARSGESLKKTRVADTSKGVAGSTAADLVTEAESTQELTKCHPDQWIDQGKKKRKSTT